jgi:hypothetical protein
MTDIDNLFTAHGLSDERVAREIGFSIAELRAMRTGSLATPDGVLEAVKLLAGVMPPRHPMMRGGYFRGARVRR